MIVSKIKIKKVIPDKGLVGFASCVIDDSLYLGNMAIFTRLNKEDEYRIVFPIKEKDGRKIEMFYPLTADAYYILEEAIANEFRKL